jgi:hypothetical protein
MEVTGGKYHYLIIWSPHLWYHGDADHIPGMTIIELYTEMNMNLPCRMCNKQLALVYLPLFVFPPSLQNK